MVISKSWLHNFKTRASTHQFKAFRVPGNGRKDAFVMEMGVAPPKKPTLNSLEESESLFLTNSGTEKCFCLFFYMHRPEEGGLEGANNNYCRSTHHIVLSLGWCYAPRETPELPTQPGPRWSRQQGATPQCRFSDSCERQHC